MHVAEKLCIAVRHNRYLEQADWVWNNLRPLYNGVISFAGKKGLERVINGTDPILVMPKFRGVTQQYEPDVWESLMSETRPGDIFADVGAFIGLYTIAVAKRAGRTGRVVAFEPDPVNCAVTKEHIKLNAIEDRVDLIQAAVGARNEWVQFKSNGDSAHVAAEAGDGTRIVECITLERVFTDRHLNILKVDVEGYEEMVLQGADNLLRDDARSPRAIYIEVHPYAWSAIGATSDSLLNLLASYNYHALTIDGKCVERIERHGEIVARRFS